MIVFDLQCQPHGHRFEGWFASSDDYASQAVRGLVTCPQCRSSAVIKAVMAPAVGRKGNQANLRPAPSESVAGGALPVEARELLARLATLQAEALKQSRWVGTDFADTSRAIHYGECEAEPIHGQATAEEARDLLEEGVAVMPLLIPVAPPDQLN